MNPGQIKVIIDEFLRLQDKIQASLNFSGGEYDPSDILMGILNGRFQFWPGKESALISEIIDYPRLRALRVFLVGGNVEEVLEISKTVEAWAREIGCVRIECGGGRRGWEKIGEKLGYKALCPNMVKDFKDENL